MDFSSDSAVEESDLLEMQFLGANMTTVNSAIKRFDTIILGSGLAGSSLAAIIAKQGFSVLLLDRDRHPRFAVGEAMLPQSAMWMWIVSQRFGIPEIGNLCTPEGLAQCVSANHGQKRAIGFAYHRAGVRHNANQSHRGTSYRAILSVHHI